VITVLAIAGAIIGVLFWADRRFPRRYYYAGPVILSDWARAAPDNDYGDVYLSADDDACDSDDYQDRGSTTGDRDE
jgi:hypothetical protein